MGYLMFSWHQFKKRRRTPRKLMQDAAMQEAEEE